MQNYGNFFDPPKVEKQIVDKWSIDSGIELFYQIDQQVLNVVLIL